MTLAHDLRAKLEPHGTVHAVGGNHTFALAPGDDVLIVLEGALDVFAVQAQNDGEPGRRHTLFRLEPGASVWPLETLVAVPLPDTVVLSLPQSALLSLARDPDTRSLALGLLSSWVTFVSVRLSGELDYERDIASDGSRVTWVRVTEGTASLNGAIELTGADRWWLIPPTAWFQKRSSTSLEVAPDASKVVSEPPERWIDPALSIVAHYVSGALDAQQERERRRLDSRRAVDAQQWRQALHKLGSTFDQTIPGSERAEEGNDPLWRAMALVADSAGCKLTVLTTPEDMDRAERVRRVARASRVPVREVALKGEWWRQDAGPMLAFLENPAASEESEDAATQAASAMTPVALLPVRGGYRIVDPAGGSPRRVTRHVASGVYPMAWSFYRTFEARKVGVMDLWRFGVRNVRRELLTMFGVGALSGLVALSTPIATGLIFSDVIPGGQRSQVAVVAMALGVAAIALAMFGLVQGFAMIRIDVRFGGSVQAALWHRLLALPVSFFRDYTAGDLATRAGAVDEIRETLSASTVSALVSTVFSSFNLVLLFIYDPQLAMLGLILVVLALAVSVVGAVAQLGRHREVAMWQGRLAGLLMQLLSAVGKIRTAGAEQRAFAQWSGLFSRQVRSSVEAARIDNLLSVFSAGYPMLTMMAIFGMVGASVSTGGMDTGDFLAFNAAFSAFLGATLQLGGIGVDALGALPAWERAKPILHAIPESHAMKADPGRLKGGIELQRVSFRYASDGPLVLKDVNFTVKPGECIAIVGPSGSGKSTLLRLLLGFEVPTTGAVYFDGHDLERVDLYALRRQLGVVLQDGAVMSGDIYSNIAGANRVELDDAWEAASKAALDEEIRAMPMGMHTVLPEGGGTLSGGQRQRLLIARSLVRNPRILLLDEATSALDNQSQAVVTRSVDQLKATRVIIAHRLTTIRHVDRILVLQDGVLVEQGSFDTLMAEDGVFAQLARRQMIGSE